jgi:hypothetical protein
MKRLDHVPALQRRNFQLSPESGHDEPKEGVVPLCVHLMAAMLLFQLGTLVPLRTH